MKLNNIMQKGKSFFLVPCSFFLSLAMLSACAESYDGGLEYEKPASVVEAEQLESYDVLMTYVSNPNFSLGQRVTAADFANQELTWSRALTNFNAVADAGALTHAATAKSDGTYDFATIQSMLVLQAELGGPNILAGTLYSPDQANVELLEAVISPTFVKGDLEKGKILYDFESDEIGATYATTKGHTATIEEDPKGETGHVLHVGPKLNMDYPVIDVKLPEGLTLGNITGVEFDFLGKTSTGLAGTGVRLGVNGREVNYKSTPQKYGCKNDEWGRGLIMLDVADLALTDEEKALTEFSLLFGSGYRSSDYYVDNLYLSWTTGVPDTYVEKTSAEKKAVLEDTLSAWIDALMEVTAPQVSEYTIVANVIDYMGPLLDETEADATGKFFLGDYMGDNFISTLADAARKSYAAHGGKGAPRLFVSEAGLLGNDTKTQILVEQLATWKKAGILLDGISAELPAVGSADVTAAGALFKALASTGLAVRLDNISVTAADDAEAAKIYAALLNAYKQNVPAAQQAGLLFSSASELWDKNNNRRLTYKSVAEGL